MHTLQQTYELQKSEIAELNKILNSLRENLAKRDMSAHTNAEALLDAKSCLERLRTEAANLRAEKELAKGNEARLLAENQVIITERTNLSSLLQNISATHADMERSANEHRRRLEAQMARLEQDNKAMRDRTTKVEEEARFLGLRKEVETKELQARIEKATGETATVREQLAITTTSLTHLQSKATELQKQLNAREEKLAVFEKHTATAASNGAAAAGGIDANRERELEITMADLRSELRNAEVEMEQSRAHVEQYKAIAQANEDSLAQLQRTYDQYKTETDSAMAQKDVSACYLNQRYTSLIRSLHSLRSSPFELAWKASEQSSQQPRTKQARQDRQWKLRRQNLPPRNAAWKTPLPNLALSRNALALSKMPSEAISPSRPSWLVLRTANTKLN